MKKAALEGRPDRLSIQGQLHDREREHQAIESETSACLPPHLPSSVRSRLSHFFRSSTHFATLLITGFWDFSWRQGGPVCIHCQRNDWCGKMRQDVCGKTTTAFPGNETGEAPTDTISPTINSQDLVTSAAVRPNVPSTAKVMSAMYGSA